MKENVTIQQGRFGGFISANKEIVFSMKWLHYVGIDEELVT